MPWASLATELLWPNALAVVPLAALVAVTCRWIPCRATTRHSLWLVVLLWFIVPPLLPELHASATGRSEAAGLVATQPQPAPVSRIPSDVRSGRRARPIFDVPAPVESPTTEFRETWPRHAWAMPPATVSEMSTASPRQSEAHPPVRREAEVAKTAVPQPASSRWQVLPSLFAVRDAVGRLPSIPTSIWLCGVAILLLMRLIQVVAFRRTMRNTWPAPGDVLDAVAAASGQIGLRRAPETLMMGDGNDGQGGLSPFVWCGWRMRLILPAGLWSRLDEPARQAVILHELAHIARRDYWVCRLTGAVCCVYWWHPVAWWVRRRLREEADFCCDGWVTWLMPRGRRAYAEALLITKRYISLPRLPIPELAIGALTDGAKRVGTRIRFIMTQTVAPRVSFWGLSMVVLLSLVGWAATPARSLLVETNQPRTAQSDIVIPVVYVPPAPPTPGERARPMNNDRALEARLLLLERRIEGLSADLTRLAATVMERGHTRSGNPMAQAAKTLRNQISAIGAMARGIDTKAAERRAQSHQLRIIARNKARRASERRSSAGSEDSDGVMKTLALSAEAQVLKARAEAADAYAVLLRSQVRVLERCAVQLQREADTLEREQARLDERLAPLRDWARADEPGPARRRM